MPVSSNELDRSVRNYLGSPDGQKLIDDETTPLWLGLIVSGGSIAVGCILMATILKAVSGIRLIVSGLTLESMRKSSGPKFRRNADRVRGLIGHPIIVGPETRANRHPSLLLGSFENVPNERLAELAASFGEIYGQEKPTKETKVLRKLLRDDEYQHDRRRLVPAPFNEGFELYLFDTFIDPTQGSEDDMPLIACMATPGKSGSILQIPWSAMEPASSRSDKTSRGPASTDSDDNDSSLSIAMLATHKGTKFSLAALKSELSQTFPDFPKFTDATEDDNSIAFQLGDAAFVMARMPGPIPWSDLESLCQTSWLWKEATQEMKSHDEHFILTIMGEPDPIERAKRLTQVIAALIGIAKTVGVYWSQAPLVISPQVFREFAVKILPDGFPAYIWVDFRVGPNNKGGSSGFTSGMKALGHMELETETSPEPPRELLDRLFGLVCYLLENGPVIRDGDTVGEDENERIKVRHTKSAFGNPQPIMRLEYSTRK